MKRQTLITLATAVLWLATTPNADAQTFNQSGKTISDLCSKKIVANVEGDINKDGIKDLFLNTEHNECAFYFGKSGSGYTLFRDYDLPIPTDAKITINDKGVLRIQIDVSDGSDIFLYRFQNGGLYLIGGKKDRHKSKHYDESYNFLTSKMIVTKGEGSQAKGDTYTLPPMPTLRFGWIPLDWDMVSDYLMWEFEDGPMDPADTEAMNILRRMQDASMLDWSLNDYQSYYGRGFSGKPEDGDGWVISGGHESPGSYNEYTDVTFRKLKNGTYSIEIRSEYQNRDYESEYDNYIDEHPEDRDLSFDEILTKAGITIPEDEINTTNYIFDDGKFIYQD